MKNVLLTGGAGYVGSHVAEQLLKKGYKVSIVDNLSTGSRGLINKKSNFFKINICNSRALEAVFKNIKFSHVMHFAASISVPESQKNPKKYYFNNVMGTQNLLDLCVKYKVRNFVFSSTCAVYGNVEGLVNENNLKKPESFYGKTKDICEELIKNYFKTYGINYKILRYFNVIGASPSGKIGQLNSHGLFKNISKNLIKKKYEISVYGKNYKTKDGTCIRDYIDVNDLAELHILNIKKNKNKNIILNCGYNNGLSVLDIINEFSKCINKKIKIKFLNNRAGDVMSIISDNKLLKKTFPNWTQRFSLQKSIKKSLDWEKISNAKIYK
jgi:UDP-glucose 4-epimerase